MNIKTKGRAGWHQATSNTSSDTAYFTRIIPSFKPLVITLALCGFLPVDLTHWISQWGNRDE